MCATCMHVGGRAGRTGASRTRASHDHLAHEHHIDIAQEHHIDCRRTCRTGASFPPRLGCRRPRRCATMTLRTPAYARRYTHLPRTCYRTYLYSASLHTSTMPHPCRMHPHSPHENASRKSTADTSSEAPALVTSSSSVRKESGA